MQQAIDILDRLNNLKNRTNKDYEFAGESQRSYDKGQIDILEEIIPIIQALGDGWIPVTPESMPCDDEEYNICTSDGLVTSVAWSTYLGSFIVGTEKWNSDYLGKITHWQPLPLPPKQ